MFLRYFIFLSFSNASCVLLNSRSIAVGPARFYAPFICFFLTDVSACIQRGFQIFFVCFHDFFFFFLWKCTNVFNDRTLFGTCCIPKDLLLPTPLSFCTSFALELMLQDRYMLNVS